MHECRNGDDFFSGRCGRSCRRRRSWRCGYWSRRGRLRNRLYRGNCRAVALLRAELGQDRQVELARQRLDGRSAVREPYRKHAAAADRVEHRAQLGGGDVVVERAEVQAERGALEEGGCGRYTLRQLCADCVGVSAADPHLRQAHLAESDLEC